MLSAAIAEHTRPRLGPILGLVSVRSISVNSPPFQDMKSLVAALRHLHQERDNIALWIVAFCLHLNRYRVKYWKFGVRNSEYLFSKWLSFALVH